MNRRTFLTGAAFSFPTISSCVRRSKSANPSPVIPGNLETIRGQYRSSLLDDIVPFWEAHGVGPDGVLRTGITDDGVPRGEARYTYSLARGMWTFSALYNRIDARRRWLDIARNTARFLMEHAVGPNGDWAYSLDPAGRVTEGPVSIWSDCFAACGLVEYSRASGDSHAFDIAVATLRRIRERTSHNDFNAIAPFSLTPGVITHGVSMMEVLLSDDILRIKSIPEVEEIHRTAVERVLKCHVDPGGLLRENVRRDCSRMDTPEGRFVIPGHAVESMWKIMRAAARRGDDAEAAEAEGVMRRHLEAGWDTRYGGLFYSLDTSGKEPDLPSYPRWDLKMWWVHTEALIGAVLAAELTRSDWSGEWYPRLHDYTFARFPGGRKKDWHERCAREGTVMTEQVGLPVKDMFHTPRMCMLVIESIDRMMRG